MAKDFSKITIDGTTYNVKVPNQLTVGTKKFDGSLAVTIEASDLGLSNALQFIGETTETPLSDGSTTSSVKIGSTTHTAAIGDVVLYGAKEFVWQGSMWKELGDGSSHALKTVKIEVGGGLNLDKGGTLGSDTKISHKDTSSQENITASGRRYITGVTLDDYGHVTGLTTGEETVTNTWRGIQNNLTSTSTTDSLSAAQGKALNEKIDALKYAGSTSAGGSANMALKLDTFYNGSDQNTYNGQYPIYSQWNKQGNVAVWKVNNYTTAVHKLVANDANAVPLSVGGTTTPVYFVDGVPAACTYTLGKSVPSDAKFTDTTYSEATTSTAGLMSAADKTKLNGIATGANAYTLPAATSSALGGIKISFSNGVLTITT